MSYEHGIAALNLEMPDTVPRTEYSAESHWELVKKVTGIEVNAFSSKEEQQKATNAFINAWDYGFVWNILIHNQIFGDKKTSMGHAVYASEGVDFSNHKSKLFDNPEDVYGLDMFETYGVRDINVLTDQFNNHYDTECARGLDTVSMTGIYVTCMSGLIELFGWDILLLAAGTDSLKFGSFINRYTDWIKQYFNALALCTSPIVMIHDDIVWTEGPFLHPDFYREFIFPNYRKLFQPLHEAGKKILFTSDGTYTMFIDDIADCCVHGFVMEPTTDMQYVTDKYGKTHVFVGNADTRILLRGTKEDIEMEVKRCMDIGKKYPGFFMNVGNHIPSNTPVDNAIWYDECYRKMAKR